MVAGIAAKQQALEDRLKLYHARYIFRAQAPKNCDGLRNATLYHRKNLKHANRARCRKSCHNG